MKKKVLATFSLMPALDFNSAKFSSPQRGDCRIQRNDDGLKRKVNRSAV